MAFGELEIDLNDASLSATLPTPTLQETWLFLWESPFFFNFFSSCFVVVVQSLNHVWQLLTPWTMARQVPLSSTISLSLLRFMAIELVMLSNHLILCHLLLLSFPASRSFPTSQFFCISSVQSLSHVRLFATPWMAAHQASLSITNSQTHVHWVSDAVQPSHPLLSPSPPAFNLYQHQGLFKWVSSSHQVAKVLELQLQHQFFQWTPGTDLLQDGLVGSPSSPRDSQESSPTPQFKSINSLVLSFLYSPTLTSIHDHWKNYSFKFIDLCWQSNVSAF